MGHRSDYQVGIVLSLTTALRRPAFSADAVVRNVSVDEFYGEAGAAVQAILGVPRFVAAQLEKRRLRRRRRPTVGRR